MNRSDENWALARSIQLAPTRAGLRAGCRGVVVAERNPTGWFISAGFDPELPAEQVEDFAHFVIVRTYLLLELAPGPRPGRATSPVSGAHTACPSPRIWRTCRSSAEQSALSRHDPDASQRAFGTAALDVAAAWLRCRRHRITLLWSHARCRTCCDRARWAACASRLSRACAACSRSSACRAVANASVKP